jgi:hypothetical protein
MRFENEARGIITEARTVLIRRRRQTSDPQERAAIDATIIMLNEAGASQSGGTRCGGRIGR